MRTLKEQINKALRKLEARTDEYVAITTKESSSIIKASIIVGNINLMDGYFPIESSSEIQNAQLNAMINAIENYDLTLLD